MGFLTWLQETEFAQFLASDPYAYPVLLCFHAMGMATVVGLVWVMSARVLGYPKGLTLETFHRMSTIALWGFAVNAVSGVGLVFNNPGKWLVDPVFYREVCIYSAAARSLSPAGESFVEFIQGFVQGA